MTSPLNRTVLFEGMFICALGTLSMVEGIRLITTKTIRQYDVLGPGNYILGVGVILTIVGLIYIIYHRRSNLATEEIVNNTLRIRLIGMVVILSLYSFLINIVGYLLASIIFFILMFKNVGFKSWLSILGLSIGISISYYILFVYLLNLPFPTGALFQ